MDRGSLRTAGLVIVEDIHHRLAVFLGEDALEAGETVLVFRLIKGTVESDLFIVDVAAYEITFTM